MKSTIKPQKPTPECTFDSSSNDKQPVNINVNRSGSFIGTMPSIANTYLLKREQEE